MKRSLLVALATLVPLAACAGTPAGLTPNAVTPVPMHHGYLSAAQLQALADQVPPPPLAGSDAELADKALSAQLTQFENTDRWLLATAHAEIRPPYALQHFDCAVGVRFAPAQNLTPATARVFQKLFEDAEVASSIVKRRTFRARPVGDDANRQPCETVSPAGRNSASYPSGSATVGAAFGAAMAQMAPDAQQASLEIGHQIAVSRAICGMHYPQDVLTGEKLGLAVVAAAQQDPQFQSDVALARLEIAQLAQTNRTNPACIAERAALAQVPAGLVR